MPHDEFIDSVAAYALGLLSRPDAEAVANHIQSCEECREEHRFLIPAATAVAYSAQAGSEASEGAVPSPLLKARVMKRVRAEATPRSQPRVWPAYAIAAASLAIAILTGIVDLSLKGQLDRDLAQTAVAAQTIADLTSLDAQQHRFNGGEVLVHGERLYLAMRALPPPPPGRVYQAWTLAKGSKTVAPSVTFQPANSGATIVRLPEAATTIAAVAVSVEPEGGSQQPTTKPIALVRI